MTFKRSIFPFTAIVGQERMKKALVLNAINPNLGGVLIRGQKGTAKSTAARALANLLPEIELVGDCKFHCNPHLRGEMCDSCARRIEAGETVPVARKKMAVVDLPLGSTEDRVLGTLDIEHAIKKGEKIFEPGILASAHRGILYVDEINLLDDHLVDVLLDAAAMGVNYVEREGISFSHPARFILVGTMNPEEGELRPQLLDRLGLCVEVEGISDPDLRVEVIRRNIQYEKDPRGFLEKCRKDEDELCSLILKAREMQDRISYDAGILKLIANIAIEMGVHGHRADISMLKVSQTIAAYHLRDAVGEDDVREAAELVLSHRMRRKPFQEPRIDKEKLDESVQKHSHRNHNHPSASREEEKKKSSEAGDGGGSGNARPSGKTAVTFETGDPFQLKKISLPRESEVRHGSGRRSKARSGNKTGRYVKSAIPSEGKTDDMAFDATIRAAAPHQAGRQGGGMALALEPQDLRQKIRERKVGSVIVFVVDSSGSMGANRRMVETKGAILSLLVDAYQKRDKVGMVAFKQDKAELVLPPTQSVELARRNLEELPTGGKTPLSKGLLKGYETLRRELDRDDKIKPLLVIISDGRTNVGMGTGMNPFEEAKQVAGDIKSSGIKSLVIDTESGFVRLGRMKLLAEELGCPCHHLEELEAETVTGLIRNAFQGVHVD